MNSSTVKLPEGHGYVYKEVRFSPTATPLRRAQSVSGSNPSANTRYVQTPVYGRNFPVLDTSYIDQSQELLEKQRANFQAERELFAQERRLWETERSLLRAKIAELESLSPRAHPISSVRRPGDATFGASQLQGSRDTLHSAQVWEGTSPGGRPTRVFRNEETPDSIHLSTITEGSDNIPPSLDAALSPLTRAVDTYGLTVSVPVPIEKLDSRLDGITLKSTALPPGVVARVITPPSPSPLTTSPPAPSEPARSEIEHRNSLKLKLSELGPPNENLLRDAGHTPMVIIEADGSRQTTQDATPAPESQYQEEAPLAPVHTEIGLPTENGESYFPDLPEDPALKGPLGLINDEEHDNSFLNELDQKLLDQARRILGSSEESTELNETESEMPTQGEQEPEFKFKKSTNFGTAFGISNLGKF
ncbi:hypothetical protein N7490_003732 [Penicillium lividum]|nr:hypothetical protein N7490_003732 [Penicillium lividum]